METTFSQTAGNHPARMFRALAVLCLVCLLNVTHVFAQPLRFYNGAPGNPVNFEIDGNYFPATTSTTSTDWSDLGNAGRGVLVKDASGNTIQGINFIDDNQVARYVQDANWGCAGCIDYSQFDGSSNKNGDDIGPGTNNWTYSSNGQGPQKNDITNAMLFLKKQGADTWLIGGVETRSVNGDSHIDFEYNQAGVFTTGTLNLGNIKGSGPNKGRTYGDFLVSVDYEIGGSNPVFSFRVWQHPGKWSVVNLTPGVDYFFAANVTTTIDAIAPGLGVDPSGNPSNTTIPLQFAEFAVKSTVLNNLFTSPNACDPDATVNIKTRSSSSFTSELKDFVLMPIVITRPPQVSCPAPQCVCQNLAGNSFTVSDATCSPIYNYTWKIVSADPTLNVSIASPNSCTSAINTTGYGTVTLRLVGRKGVCADSCTTTITVKPKPGCSITGSGSVTPISTTTYTGPADATTYQWSVSGNASIEGSSTSRNVQVKASASCGTFTLTLVTGNPGCTPGTSCTSTCTKDVTVEPCVRYCTYTQGAYGNAGGTHCNGQTTPAFVAGLLNTPLVVGAGTRTVTFNSSDVNCLISVLPSGGTAASLGGSYTCSNVQPLNNGKIYNILLGQTITLGLNLRISGSPLSGLSLNGRFINTATSNVSGCGPQGGTLTGPIQTWTLPASVVTYLGSNNTVAHLYQLANNALGRVYIPSGNNPSLTDINNAVDIINNAFDGCRQLVSISNTSGSRLAAESASPGLTGSVTVFPNPFRDQVAVRIDSEKTGQLEIALYSITGERIALVHQGEITTAGMNEFRFDSMGIPSGIYLCKVILGNEMSIQRVVLSRD